MASDVSPAGPVLHLARLGGRAGREDHVVTTTSPMRGLPAARRRRLIVIGLLRASAATCRPCRGVLPVAARPPGRCSARGVPRGWIDRVDRLTVYQVRAIIKARYPAIRAIEALATTAPLFLLLFAATYFLMAQADLSNFNVQSLTRTDALYFTVTVFTTVGFGDIVATIQLARLVVTVQMILDLGVLGLGIRVFVGAVQRGRQRHTEQQETESSWALYWGQPSVGAIGHVGRRRPATAFARPVRAPLRRGSRTCRGGLFPGHAGHVANRQDRWSAGADLGIAIRLGAMLWGFAERVGQRDQRGHTPGAGPARQ